MQWFLEPPKIKSLTVSIVSPSICQSKTNTQLWMWQLDCKESWALKNWCFWTVVLEKTLENPMDCNVIQPVHPKGDQSWVFFVRSDAKAESWLIGKDPDAGKGWRQEEKGMTVDKMVGLHHWLDGCEFEQALGVGDGQGSLAFYSPLGCKESDTTEQLNWVVTWSNFLNYQCLFPYLQSKDHILSFVLLALVLSNKY